MLNLELQTFARRLKTFYASSTTYSASGNCLFWRCRNVGLLVIIIIIIIIIFFFKEKNLRKNEGKKKI